MGNGNSEHVARPAVLVVEDEHARRVALSAWIEASMPAISVREADSVPGALKIIRAEAIKVLLVDIWSPKMKGIKGVKSLHAIRRQAPGIAVVICSNLGGRARQVAARAAGAVAFVSKRRMIDDLLPVLRDLLLPRNGAVAADGEFEN